jgi:NitT/TauT family transport system permease protein
VNTIVATPRGAGAAQAPALSVARIGAAGRNVLWALGFPAVLFVVWEALSDARSINPILFSSPGAIARVGWQQISSGVLLANAAVSLGELVAGFALAALLGILVGIAMGVSRRMDYALEPVVIGLYSAPIVALYPLLILWFGLGFTAILVLVVLFGIFPIIVNTALGVRLVDPILMRTGRSFGASPAEVLWKIVLPAALPSIVIGLRLALGRALIGVVVAELFMGSAGLGYAIGVAASQLQTDEVFWGILVLGVLGVSLIELVGLLEHRLPERQQ